MMIRSAPRLVGIVLIMHRLHEDDLVGENCGLA